MHVSIDESICTGCGLCERICPEVFQVGEDNVAKVIGPCSPEYESACQEAADSCPVNAISIS